MTPPGKAGQPELSSLFHRIDATLGFVQREPVRVGLTKIITQFRPTRFPDRATQPPVSRSQ